MKTKPNYLAIATFYIIAVALRYLSNKTSLLVNIPNEFIKVILQASGPAVGALVAFSVFKRRPSLSLSGNYRNLWTPFLLYWALPVGLICSFAYFSKGSLPVAAVTAVLIYGLLEEIGWRGFLQQELKGLPPWVNVMLVATMWFAWHLNFEWSSSNLLFFGILILGSWGIGKVADSTRSLFALAAFHSLNNFFPVMNSSRLLILAILLTIWVGSLVMRKRGLKTA